METVIIFLFLSYFSFASKLICYYILLQPIKILALSNYDELPYIQSVMDAGAKGYVLKNIEPAEMLNAIKTILFDKIYYCSEESGKHQNKHCKECAHA